MNNDSDQSRNSRRRFLKGALGTSAVMLLAACAPATAPSPTAAPAKPAAQPTTPPAKPAAQPTAAKPAAAAASPAAAAAKPAASPAAAAPAAAKPGVTGPLRLGVILPYSKVYAVLGESITNGMQLYFDSVGGTAGGRKIEMIKEDTETDAQVGLRKTRKLVEQDRVDLLTGVVGTNVLYAIRDYVHENKALFLCSNAGGQDLLKPERRSPYIFRTSFSNQQPSIPMGPYVAEKIAKKVVTCAADYGAGRESMAGFKDGFTKAGGTVVAEIWPPFPNTDYAPFLEQIRQARPEAVYCFFAGSDAVNFVKQFAEFGLKNDIKLTGSGFMLEEDVFPAQGEAAVGGVSGLHWAINLENPLNNKFKADYKQKFGKDADVYAVQGFDTARVIVEALNRTQGDTSNKDGVVKAIEGLSFDSPRGPFKIDAELHNPIQNIYAREVRKGPDGRPTNFVIETFKDVRAQA